MSGSKPDPHRGALAGRAGSAGRRDVSVSLLAISALVIVPAAVVIGAQVAHALSVNSFWAILGFGAAALGLVLLSGAPVWRSVRPARPTSGEWVLWVGMGILVAVAFDRVFAGSWRVPSSRGVDFAHHGAITGWILEHHGFPTTRVPQLDEFSLYPNASHVVAATLAWALRLPALTATWLVGLAAVFIGWLVQGAIVVELVGLRRPASSVASRPKRGWGLGLIVVPVSIAGWRFTIGMVSSVPPDNFE